VIIKSPDLVAAVENLLLYLGDDMIAVIVIGRVVFCDSVVENERFSSAFELLLVR
jgi:hypothetical protein